MPGLDQLEKALEREDRAMVSRYRTEIIIVSIACLLGTLGGMGRHGQNPRAINHTFFSLPPFNPPSDVFLTYQLQSRPLLVIADTFSCATSPHYAT